MLSAVFHDQMIDADVCVVTTPGQCPAGCTNVSCSTYTHNYYTIQSGQMHANDSIELRKQMNSFKKPETMKNSLSVKSLYGEELNFCAHPAIKYH